MAAKIIENFIKMALFKKGGAIATDKAVQFSANALEKRLINLGIDPRTLNNQTELKQVLAYVKQMEDAAFDQKFSGIMKNQNLFKKEGDVIPFKQKRSFAEEIEAMKKRGDLVDKDEMVISDKITEREMFKNSNLNKPTIEGQMEKINNANKRLTEILKEREEMFKPKTDAEIKAKLEKQNKDAVERIKKKKEDDPEFYTGGMVDVEPSLSDIGHGSDSLMARTRLISPNNQATTSTGLNYLLAEDNDNIRVPFSDGKNFEMYLREREGIEKNQNMERLYREYLEDMRRKKVANQKQMVADGGRIGFSAGGGGRRAFLKLMAALTGGVAAVKSGILGLGEGAGKKAVTETIKKSAGSGQPPPYFFELMETITKNGKEIKSYGERVKQTVAPSKDGKSELLMTEDLNTGSVQIKKIHKEGDDMVTKSEEMNYTKNMGDESTQGKPTDDYEEVTEFNSRIYKDEFNEPDFVDGIDVESIIKEVDVNPQDVGKVKYKPRADGGRIGFSVGNLAKLGITGSSRRFLEKVFGKQNLETMIKRDPEMHRGLLEVVEMFRNRDKEGLKMYMQKFLPHMDDAQIEEFIIGGPGIDDMSGQLIRLGSGRDYKAKIDMIKKADNVKKLENLDVTEEMIRKPNASGGIQTMLGE